MYAEASAEDEGRMGEWEAKRVTDLLGELEPRRLRVAVSSGSALLVIDTVMVRKGQVLSVSLS